MRRGGAREAAQAAGPVGVGGGAARAAGSGAGGVRSHSPPRGETVSRRDGRRERVEQGGQELGRAPPSSESPSQQ